MVLLLACLSPDATCPEVEEAAVVTESVAPDSDPVVEPVEACSDIGIAEMQALADELEVAVEAARRDEATFGEDGDYYTAAIYGREFLEAGHTHLVDGIAWMEVGGDDDPDVTTYAEAYQVAGFLWSATQQIDHGVHWASVSVGWHGGADGVQAMEGGLAALSHATELRSRALRCYVSAAVEE